MRVLVTGANGQLGTELTSNTPGEVELIALGRDDLDVTNRKQVLKLVQQQRPDLIVNAAGYTAVDRAEQEPDRACAVNGEGAANLAQAANAIDARLICVSTDYVFDGYKSVPYLVDDPASPLCVYGASKLEGERRVTEATRGQAVIIRSAWIYSAHSKNFFRTMLRLLQEQDHVCVVADQVGTPTWARSLARAIWVAAAEPNLAGTYHWTDAGVASWYDFAEAIKEEALSVGLISRSIPIHPVRTQDYPTLARRPAYVVLDKTTTWSTFGMTAPHWRENLRAMLREIKDSSDA